eukprot:SAG22_NODE_21699_length_254_cov_2.329032_1_plen_27_part_01
MIEDYGEPEPWTPAQLHTIQCVEEETG